MMTTVKRDMYVYLFVRLLSFSPLLGGRGVAKNVELYKGAELGRLSLQSMTRKENERENNSRSEVVRKI